MPLPVATTESVALWPGKMPVSWGGTVMLGGTHKVTVAVELSAGSAHPLLTRTQ